jgi:hypothetical protein
MNSLVDELAALLHRGHASDLVLDVTDRLRERHGVDAEVWLADYAQQTLHGVVTGQVEPIDDSAVGRCFAAQSPTDLLLPLTSRGDRIGVLEVTEQVPGLEAFAPLLAAALKAIGSQSGTFEQHRRRKTMTVAAELQWALLPGQAYRDADVSLGAMLEPAYSIAGDAYDWSRDGSVLNLAVLDGTGRGVPAALSTTLALGALRNARYAGVSLPDQAALADQAVFAHHLGATFVSALLFSFDIDAGTATVVDAGSPLLFRVRDGRVEGVELEAQLPLGMFEETLYVEQPLDLAPGDRLVIVSDGVHSVPQFALEQTLREARLLSAAELTRFVIRRVGELNGDSGPDDDAVVVCLDWHPAS